ncbi:hypothetical protein CGZ80_07675 [Rhodopirellula sp. MGV]|nr:hypothetical protein CGZ80_07675 [Rhodopirellula sp. MGV]PNY36085.1 hypothetical protein C2E31_14625 [Rhodopirellula baltica]PNY36123.1 hypothetical protein C2E31_14840 [Rhodopirellula baltica]
MKPRRRALAFKITILLGLIPTISGGCYFPQVVRSTFQPYQDLAFRSSLKRRAIKKSKAVWKASHEAAHAHDACVKDFREGFQAAFVETALGNEGCPPPIPERKLGSCEAITHTYPAAVPWFNGYRIGHAQAVACGVDRWRFAPLDPQYAASCCSSVLPASHVQDNVIIDKVIIDDASVPGEIPITVHPPTVEEDTGVQPPSWVYLDHDQNSAPAENSQPSGHPTGMDFN